MGKAGKGRLSAASVLVSGCCPDSALTGPYLTQQVCIIVHLPTLSLACSNYGCGGTSCIYSFLECVYISPRWYARYQYQSDGCTTGLSSAKAKAAGKATARAKACPYAQSLPSEAGKICGKTGVVCRLISDVIGWEHAVVGMCPGCPQNANAPALAKEIDALLRNRIVLNWTWDMDPRFSKSLRDDLKATLVLYKLRNGEKAAADALVEAVEHGLPANVGKALRLQVFPEK